MSQKRKKLEYECIYKMTKIGIGSSILNKRNLRWNFALKGISKFALFSDKICHWYSLAIGFHSFKRFQVYFEGERKTISNELIQRWLIPHIHEIMNNCFQPKKNKILRFTHSSFRCQVHFNFEKSKLFDLNFQRKKHWDFWHWNSLEKTHTAC